MGSKEVLKQIEEINSWNGFFDQCEIKGYQQKNSSLSAQVRKEGNNLFTRKNHDAKTHVLALQAYTRSIALATEDSEEQALGYGNRSALLMHLQKYKKCLIDINRALRITQSEDLKKKLLLRKEKCLPLINKDDKDIKNIKNSKNPTPATAEDITFFLSNFNQQLGSCLPDKAKDKLHLPKTGTVEEFLDKFRKVKVPKIVPVNETIPNFSKSLTLKYSQTFGRHVVATKDIKPGEILVVEKGFGFPKIDKIYLACSYCLNFCWCGIPCPHCVFAIYCSEKCKTRAWEEYHDIECSALPPLFSEGFRGTDMTRIMLIMRLFIKFIKNEGPQNIIDQAKTIDNDKDAHINGFFTNGKFDNSKFRSVYNLLSFEANAPTSSSNDVLGSTLILLLTRYTEILKDHKNSKYYNSLVVQLRKLLIKLKPCIEYNSSTFRDYTCGCIDRMKYTDDCVKCLGYIVTPCCSLFNHSCFPNVSGTYCKGGKLILYSTRSIKKNDQVFVNYGLPFLNYSTETRRSTLKLGYHFTCNCEACKNDWSGETKDQNKKLGELFAAIPKIDAELEQFIKKANRKKFEYFSLAHSNKFNEIVYKHLSNHEAALYTYQNVEYIQKFIRRLHGVEVKIPEKC